MPLGNVIINVKSIMKTDIRGRGYEGLNWFQLAQGRVQWQGAVNLLVP